jgi:tetratricopeptide (TPR) repeat protein
VVAVTYHYGGRFDLAQTWYAKSRHHATSDGDEAMLSAIMHNMAALQANEARQAAFTQSRDVPQARRALLSAESTGHFDAMVGTGSLDALVPLVRAHVLALQGRWAEAVDLYEANYEKGLGQGLDRMQSFMGADMAWCRLQLGQVTQATEQADAAAAAVGADLDVDDRAGAHSRLVQIYTQLGRTADAERHAAQAAIDWQTHEGEQAAAVELMGKVLAKLPT